MNSDQAYEILESGSEVTYDLSFDLARFCAQLLRDTSTEAVARDLIIRAMDVMELLPKQQHQLWNDLVEAAGLYPYVRCKDLTGSARLRYEVHRSPFLSEIYFHEEQANLANLLHSKMSVIASAPTSFGKSLIIDEIIASKRYKNIVIIQPTLALLDETRKRFRMFHGSYNVVLSTSQVPAEEKGNIFLFTAERVVEYKHFPPIEFFVIDEFYKLSLNREDDRAIALNQAFYKLLKHTKFFYLLGPPVDSIPVDSNTNVPYLWFPSKFATVATDEIALANNLKKNTERKRELLFKKLTELEEPTIVYCAAPASATKLANQFGKWIETYVQPSRSEDVRDMCEWIAENVNPQWCLCSLLQIGVAFHHGALPRHLGSSIVDAFNSGSIRWLFCTSTLIEGVNTAAKNIILFDKKKGIKPIDYFDFRNIAGRSGRMLRHYIGRVFKFEDAPEQLNLHIDLPVFTQDNAPTELLIGMDDSDLKPEGKKKVEHFRELDRELQAVIQQNPALPIEGQLKIVEIIASNLDELHPLLSWRSFPTYEQLLEVIKLAWGNLLRPNESKGGIVSPAQLAVMTLQYASVRSVSGLISIQLNSDYWKNRHPVLQDRIDATAFNILNVTRHWFDYKLPTLLCAVSNLQGYVFISNNRKPGDYRAFATQIEHSFLEPQFAGLSEYGIPRSAIVKIAKRMKGLRTVEEVLQALIGSRLETFGFSRYEYIKVVNAF